MKVLTSHPQWSLACKIIQKLVESGEQAYLAGGCVRDALLGRIPSDLDIATSATPDKVESLFENTLPIGKLFGTIHVVEKLTIEVTTFREDGVYKDGRHPEQVNFSDLQGDASRRDFTVNAMYFDVLEQQVIDFYSGQEDLKKRIIRCVGNPLIRFEEDKLRLLRALRFASQLNFLIHDGTWKAIQKRAHQIDVVSKERIYQEVKKMVEGDYFDSTLELFKNSGLMEALFPDLNLYKQWNDFLAIFRQKTMGDFVFFLSLIAHYECNIYKCQSVEKLFAKVALSRKEQNAIHKLVSNLTVFTDEKDFYQACLLMNSDLGTYFLELWKLEILRRRQRLDSIEVFLDEYTKLLQPNGKLFPPLVRGQDLIASGFQPGPVLGQVLEDLRRKQLEGKILNKEQALQEAALILKGLKTSLNHQP